MSAPRPSAHDPLAWSFTRRTLLDACERAFAYHYLVAPTGSRAPVGSEARRAWVLKQSTALALLVGVVCHNAARTILVAIRDGRPRPDLDSLVAGARFTLNQVWHTSVKDIDRFWRWPGVYTALREVINRGTVREDEIERARWRFASVMRHLHAAAVLDDVARCGADEIVLDDAPTLFVAPGEPPVWVALDLAYRHHAPETCEIEIAAPTWCVADIKTGRPDEAAERLQLAGYCLWLAASGRPMTDGRYLGRIVRLLDGSDRWYALTEADLRAARGTIRRDVDRMRALLLDPARRLARPLDELALAVQPRQSCPNCAFLCLCTERLGRRPWAHLSPPPPERGPNG